MYELTVLTDLSNLPRAIESNYEAVKAELQNVLQKYDGLIVTDENFKDMKDTRAEINKGITVLKSVGKEVKDKLLAPFFPFDEKVKELAGIAIEKRDGLDRQIKEIEVRRRAEKREKIANLLSAALEKGGIGKYAGCDHLKTLIDRHPQWLNESVSLKKATAEMEAEVKRCVDAVAQVKRIYEGDLEVVRVKAEQLVPACAFDIGAVCEKVNAFKAEEERLAEARRRDEEKRRQREAELAARREAEERARAAAAAEAASTAAIPPQPEPVVATEPEPLPVPQPETPARPPVVGDGVLLSNARSQSGGDAGVKIDPMQAAMAALRSVRAEIHGEAPAAPVVPPAPKPDIWRLTMRFEAPMSELSALKEFLDQRGISYEMLGDAEKLAEPPKVPQAETGMRKVA